MVYFSESKFREYSLDWACIIEAATAIIPIAVFFIFLIVYVKLFLKKILFKIYLKINVYISIIDKIS